MSIAIDKLLALSKVDGLKLAEDQTGQWSKAYVFGFREKMPCSVRDAGANEPSLHHFAYDGDPHNRPHEGFMDDATQTAIDFAK